MTKTKEQIALDHGLCNCDEVYKSMGMTAPDCPLHAFAVEESMQIYADEQLLSLQDENKRLKDVFVELIAYSYSRSNMTYDEYKAEWLAKAGLNPKED